LNDCSAFAENEPLMPPMAQLSVNPCIAWRTIGMAPQLDGGHCPSPWFMKKMKNGEPFFDCQRSVGIWKSV
jgi:hypothetical protein